MKTRLKYAFSDDQENYTKDLIASEAHVALAKEAAEKSMVLIKNEGLLPLEAAKGKKVLVLGKISNLENTGDIAVVIQPL